MTITVELPDDIGNHPNASREALEALALAGYRTGKLSALQAREMLGMQRLEFLEFLKLRDVPDHTYGLEQLLADIQTGDEMRAEGSLPP